MAQGSLVAQEALAGSAAVAALSMAAEAGTRVSVVSEAAIQAAEVAMR